MALGFSFPYMALQNPLTLRFSFYSKSMNSGPISLPKHQSDSLQVSPNTVSANSDHVLVATKQRNLRFSLKITRFSFTTRLWKPEEKNDFYRSRLKSSKAADDISFDDAKQSGEKTHQSDPDADGKIGGETKNGVFDSDDDDDGPVLMNQDEREELRRKIRAVIDMNPDVEEEQDPVEKRKKMEKLLADYPLVVEEEDPDWPEDADGWGFNLSQFFNKITIKNKKKADVDDDYDSDKEIEWRDDDYIKAVRDITSKGWEEIVFKDISPLIILVHNRYRRPRENERARNELEKAVQIFWDSRLPSPRCVAVDAVVELDLVSALKVSVFPEILYTKAGKILYRERAVRPADELSKIMAFFYYGAARPPCLKKEAGDFQEQIPSIQSNLL